MQQCLKRDRLVTPDINKNDVIEGGGRLAGKNGITQEYNSMTAEQK